MPEMKQPLEMIEQNTPVGLFRRIGQRRQELDIPDQMGQTKLPEPIGVFHIRAEKVADDRAAKAFAEHFSQHLARSPRRAYPGVRRFDKSADRRQPGRKADDRYDRDSDSDRRFCRCVPAAGVGDSPRDDRAVHRLFESRKADRIWAV